MGVPRFQDIPAQVSFFLNLSSSAFAMFVLRSLYLEPWTVYDWCLFGSLCGLLFMSTPMQSPICRLTAARDAKVVDLLTHMFRFLPQLDAMLLSFITALGTCQSVLL